MNARSCPRWALEQTQANFNGAAFLLDPELKSEAENAQVWQVGDPPCDHAQAKPQANVGFQLIAGLVFRDFKLHHVARQRPDGK